MERREVEMLVNDICLCYFRKKSVEYTGERKVSVQVLALPNYLLLTMAYLLVIILISRILPFPFDFLAIIPLFMIYIRLVEPKPAVDLSHCFSSNEEPLVVEFIITMPELSSAEIQLIKSLRLAFLYEDKDQLLRSLSECRSFPGLSRWSFIEWLSARIPVN